MNLVLHLNGKYFDEIASGEKQEEYRLVTTYWAARLEDRKYENIILLRGYPKRDDFSKTIIRKWRGCYKRSILHEHFGGGKLPVEVYVIDVAGAI